MLRNVTSAEIGSGYFQETHPQPLFQEFSHLTMTLIGAKSVHGIMRDSLVLAEKELAAEGKAQGAQQEPTSCHKFK